MPDWQLQTPVAFLIFNRPDVTEQVFSAIAQARPPKLLVVADGPRPERPGEADLVARTRAVLERVDWDCEVLTNFAETNMGCGPRVSSGLSWVFEQVEEAIILEDDCLPDPTFFRYCEELLEHYRNDERIMLISGTNVLGHWRSNEQSYLFSHYGGIWGWASWRRAWQHYDYEMRQWDDLDVRTRIAALLADPDQFRHRAESFDQTRQGRINTWDYQWSFARLSRSGLAAVPASNLISNIGFGAAATHTQTTVHGLANLPTVPLDFPLVGPAEIAPDRAYDRAFYERHHPRISLIRRAYSLIQRKVGIL